MNQISSDLQEKFPLDGVRVIDFGSHLTGPYCAQLLRKVGAEVIKVEKPNAVTIRNHCQATRASDRARNFAINHGKQRVIVDLDVSADLAAFRDLLASADVLVTNYRPSVLKRRGLDPASLAKAYPDLIVVSLTGAGWEAPKNVPDSFDDGMAQALSGLMMTTGWQDDGPVHAPFPIGALSAGIYGAIAVIAGLNARARGARVAPIGVSMIDALAYCQEYAFMHAANLGHAPKRNGGRHPTGVPSQVFKTHAGLLAIMAPSDHEFRRLCIALDARDLAEDVRFGSMIDRLLNRDDLIKAIERLLMKHPATYWFELLSSRRIACAPVRSFDAVLSDRLVTERGLVVDAQTDDGERFPMMNVPGQTCDPVTQSEAGPKAIQGAETWVSASRAFPPSLDSKALPIDALLKGTRVVDLTRYLAGPFCTTLLAELGADVSKIEPPGGDPARGFGPMISGTSGYFASVNRLKQTGCVDLKTPEGLETVRNAVHDADILVENFRPGTMKRLGLGNATLRENKPSLETISISGFGQTSSFAERPAFDMTIQAYAGLMHLTGYVGSGPTRLGFSIGDIAAGLFAALMSVARLFAQTRGAPGQDTDIAMFDALLAMMEAVAIEHALGACDDGGSGGQNPSLVPSGAFPTKDGHIYISAASDLDFMALWSVLGLSDDLDSADFGTVAKRIARRGDLIAAMSARTEMRSSVDLLEQLQAAGVRSCPVLTVPECLEQVYKTEGKILSDSDLQKDLKLAKAPFRQLAV